MFNSLLVSLVAATAFIHYTLAGSPKVLGFDFTKERNVVPVSRRMNRRDSVEVAIGNDVILYYVNVSIGTPPQPFILHLDTGSSDTWVPSSNSDICMQSLGCQTAGAFDPDYSSTFVDIAPGAFNISYVDGSGVTGDYFSDTLTIGRTRLRNLQMGLATSASRPLGILGIGYAAGEAIALQMPGSSYPNIIDVMKQQGFIDSKSYSLWLNDLNDDTGSILFGGVDTSKYTGQLIGVPVQNDTFSGTLASFTVAFTSLSGQDSSSSRSFMREEIAVPAILDCGTTATFLPDSVAIDILTLVGAVPVGAYGYLVPCSLSDYKANFTFGFGGSNGPSINVPLEEFVLPLPPDESGQPLTFIDGTDACSFGIEPAEGRPVLLGDTFLRSAYVVYDLENNVIALAQTDFDGGSPNITEFSEGDAIPGMQKIASDVTVSQTFTGHPLITAVGTQTGGARSRLTESPGAASFSLGSGGSGTSGGSQASSTSSTSAGSSQSSGAAVAQRIPGVELMNMISGLVIGGAMVLGGSLVFTL